jgi:hypothetical protein
MERREPTLEDGASRSSGHDWGNLRFRRRAASGPGTPDDNADARFWIWIFVFLFVAAAYPWYSYWVNAHLLARDLQRAGEEIGRQLEASDAEMQRQAAQLRDQNIEAARRARLAAVRVVGAFPGQGGPIAIVHLGSAQVREASPVICREAGAMMGRSLVGEMLRIQRERGDQPAVDIGNLHC